eukprot:GHVS01036277.1.p1 GENE.GHVS01036277.1~~GHVS01036277.1.p1  ORF type:complete len:978 (+),score=68.18 GHVS01036277.1:106-2934(+)
MAPHVAAVDLASQLSTVSGGAELSHRTAEVFEERFSERTSSILQLSEYPTDLLIHMPRQDGDYDNDDLSSRHEPSEDGDLSEDGEVTAEHPSLRRLFDEEAPQKPLRKLGANKALVTAYYEFMTKTVPIQDFKVEWENAAEDIKRIVRSMKNVSACHFWKTSEPTVYCKANKIPNTKNNAKIRLSKTSYKVQDVTGSVSALDVYIVPTLGFPVKLQFWNDEDVTISKNIEKERFLSRLMEQCDERQRSAAEWLAYTAKAVQMDTDDGRLDGFTARFFAFCVGRLYGELPVNDLFIEVLSTIVGLAERQTAFAMNISVDEHFTIKEASIIHQGTRTIKTNITVEDNEDNDAKRMVFDNEISTKFLTALIHYVNDSVGHSGWKSEVDEYCELKNYHPHYANWNKNCDDEIKTITRIAGELQYVKCSYDKEFLSAMPMIQCAVRAEHLQRVDYNGFMERIRALGYSIKEAVKTMTCLSMSFNVSQICHFAHARISINFFVDSRDNGGPLFNFLFSAKVVSALWHQASQAQITAAEWMNTAVRSTRDSGPFGACIGRFFWLAMAKAFVESKPKEHQATISESDIFYHIITTIAQTKNKSIDIQYDNNTDLRLTIGNQPVEGRNRRERRAPPGSHAVIIKLKNHPTTFNIPDEFQSELTAHIQKGYANTRRMSKIEPLRIKNLIFEELVPKATQPPVVTTQEVTKIFEDAKQKMESEFTDLSCTSSGLTSLTIQVLPNVCSNLLCESETDVANVIQKINQIVYDHHTIDGMIVKKSHRYKQSLQSAQYILRLDDREFLVDICLNGKMRQQRQKLVEKLIGLEDSIRQPMMYLDRLDQLYKNGQFLLHDHLAMLAFNFAQELTDPTPEDIVVRVVQQMLCLEKDITQFVEIDEINEAGEEWGATLVTFFASSNNVIAGSCPTLGSQISYRSEGLHCQDELFAHLEKDN